MPSSSDDVAANATPPTWSALNSSPLDPVQPSLAKLSLGPEATRYEARRRIGKGGMGEVQLVHDTRIGRDVARKVMLSGRRADPGAQARFLHEAQIQGQLEHPSIVPVHDLGVDAQGCAYFTMKCLRGLTLAEILHGLAKGDPALARAYSRRKLLGAFLSLCLAVDFAHARGVVHRDLKPANVMLGDYGEVYLLDWGVAKVLDGGRGEGVASAPRLDLAATAPGDILGTPGYMAPEQAWGKANAIDARSDVYALGAILFEILTLERLHPKGDLLDALQSTVRGVDARASVRAPDRDVPPELDAVCVQATRPDPAERYPSARALHDAIERFLDGDRDLELRRDLSSRHAALAEAAVDEALAGAEEARRRALGEVGRALALDAGNGRARRALARIFTEPPRELPAAVQAAMAHAAAGRDGLLLRLGIGADLIGVSLAALVSALWVGVRDWGVFAAVLVFSAIAAAAKGAALKVLERPATGWIAYAAFLANIVAVVCLGRGFGPLHYMPLLLVTFTFMYSMTPRPAYRRAVTATAMVALFAAVAVEVTGLLPRSYAFRDGAMIILPRAVTHSEGPTTAALLVSTVFMILVLSRIAGQFQAALWDAERRAFLHTWQLQQLLPDAEEGARAGVSP